MLLPAAITSAARTTLFIKPNPVDFGGVAGNSSKTLAVTVQTSGTQAHPRISITSGQAEFKIKEGNPSFTCPVIHHGQRCTFHVVYHPSSASQDTGTLRATDLFKPTTNRATAELKGHRVVPHPPSCTIAMKRHQKLIKQVKKKNGKKKLKRSPFRLSMTQNQDGQVSASAAGTASDGKPISLEAASGQATAGNPVLLKLALKQPSEQRIIADVKQNLEPQMNLTGTCQNNDGDIRQVHAVIRFRDSKPGKPFGYPLIADATPK